MNPSAEASMGRTRWRDRLVDAAPIFVAAFPFLVLTLTALVQSHHPGSVNGDLAATELRIRAATHLQEFLGPYSRFGWSHPGPIAFYWDAPFYLISGNRTGGLAAASAAANLGWIVVIVAAARSAAGKVAAWIAAATTTAFAAIVGMQWLHEPWNPFEVILPVAAYAVLGAAVLSGVRWALPVAALAATWAVQTHIGTAPNIGVIVLVTIGPAIWVHRHDWRSWRVATLLAAGGTVVLWIPPLIDQLRHPPGNLDQIHRFLTASHDPPHSVSEVFRFVAPQLTLTSHHLGNHLGTDNTRFRPVEPAEILAMVLLFSVVAFGGWRARRNGAHFQLGCCLAALGGAAASVLSTRAATGPLLAYFTSFSTGIGLVMWFAALMTIAEIGQSVWVRAHPEEPLSRRLRPLTMPAASLLVIGTLWLSVGIVRAPSFAERSNNRHVTTLALAAQRSLGPDRNQPVLIVVGKNLPWQQATGLAAMLARAGYHVRTTRNWVFLFGYDYRPRGNEQRALLVIGAHDHHFPKPPSSAVFVAQSDVTQVWKVSPDAAMSAVEP